MSSWENDISLISKTYNTAEFKWSVNVCSDEIFETDSCLESPTFSFSDCSWCVRMFPKGFGGSLRRNKWISLFLTKKESQSEKYVSFYLSFVVQNKEGYYQDSHCFNKNENCHVALCVEKEEFREYWPVETRDCSQLVTIKIFISDAPSKENIQKDIKMLYQNYKDLLLHDKEHDLILKVKGKEFLVHQNIMRFRCPVFKSMLAHDMLERNRGVVEIPDCDPLAFEQFLFYVYSGNLETLDESVMLGLYYIADKYDMTFLKERCRKFIQSSLSARNLCHVIRLAFLHNDHALLLSGRIFFAFNKEEVLATTEFKTFYNENPLPANIFLIKSINDYEPEIRGTVTEIKQQQKCL